VKHTVLVPAWRRPDMLHACLMRLEAAATRDVTVVVSLDRRYDPECRIVAETFSRRFPSIYLREMHWHEYRGNSYNVISGIRDSLKLGGDLLHIVEDDILVSRGYFRYHEAMHQAAPQAFAVSACRNQNTKQQWEQAAYLHASYQSLGVSFRPEIAEKVIQHNVPAYYKHMVSYCQNTFRGSVIQPGHAEQDGLINRIREAECGKTVYTTRPRAFHAGFNGYNRCDGQRLIDGTIEERAMRILSMTSEEMNALAGKLKDHEVIDLEENLSTTPEEEALSAIFQA
jgi:hypothetical protein